MSSRILIVEDDRSFALQVKEVVDKHGHTALVAATGPAGIEMFERHKPDLLLVDVMLPGMTGIQVIERVRQLDSGDDVPILLMSAMYRSKDFFRDDMERLHLLEFLPKPFSLIDFGRRMDALLGEPAKGRDQVRELAGRGGRGSAPGEEKASASSLAARPSHPRAATDHTVSKSDGSPFETDALTPDRYVQLVSTLFHSHSSGSFDLLGVGTRRSIHFLNGYAVWVDVPDVVDGLPRFLVQERLLSLSQMGELAEMGAAGGSDLRRALVEMKLFPADEVGPVLESWITHELQQGLGHRGKARFERSEGFSQSLQIQEVNPIQALWEGVYRIADDEWFEDELSDLDGRPVGRTRSFPRLIGYLGRDPRLRTVAEAIREPKTADQFLDYLADDRGLGTRSLWFLVYSGLVSFAEPHPGEESPRHEAKGKAKARAAPKAEATAKAAQPSTAKAPPAASPAPEVAEPTAAEVKATPAAEPEPATAAAAEAKAPTPDQEPADQHVFFEPSRKKVVEPEPEDDRNPIEIVRLDHAEKMDLNHYGFLEIEQDATGADIEAAYGRLAPAYRPRNLGADASDDDKDKARQLLARLVSAHEELSEPKRRARYDMSDASRKPGKRGALERDVESWDDEASAGSGAGAAGSAAEGPWYPGQHDPKEIDRRAEDLDSEDAEKLRSAHLEIQRSQYKKAFARLDELRAVDPSNSFVLADLGWCRFRDNPGNEREIEKALEWVDLALAFEPGNRNALEVKARVLMSQSEPSSTAGVVLRNLIKVASGHSWAEGELSRLERLQAAAEAQDKPGGLRGMLGRKK